MAPEDGGAHRRDAGREPRVDAGSSDGGFSLVTEVLAPLAGPSQRHPGGQEMLHFHGTDLGYTFSQNDRLRILFGDTVETAAAMDASNDDSFGELAFGNCPAGAEVEDFIAKNRGPANTPFWQRPGPELKFATTGGDELKYIELQHGEKPLAAGVLQTPTGAFTDGQGRAFALFNRSDFARCGDDPNVCPADLPCNSSPGTCVGLSIEVPCTLGAAKGEPGACAEGATCVEKGGYCRDPDTSIDDGERLGQLLASAQIIQVGVESADQPGLFQTTPWITNKFTNVAVRTVEDFDPERPAGEGNDYRPASGADSGSEKVLLWGRPNYVGAQARKREAQLYFAVADMPALDADGAPIWSPRYFAGLDDDGRPRFVSEQSAAVPLDLSGGASDPHESVDLVNQMSVSWVEPIARWVLIYGGDLDLGVARYYNPGAARDPDGAIQIRFAEQPWGPWSPVQPLLRAGDPEHPELDGGQYAPGGILYHPMCTGEACVAGEPPDPGLTTNWGWLYAPNVIDCWTTARDAGGVDLYWNVSTFSPYQVVLMRTRITPAARLADRARFRRQREANPFPAAAVTRAGTRSCAATPWTGRGGRWAGSARESTGGRGGARWLGRIWATPCGRQLRGLRLVSRLRPFDGAQFVAPRALEREPAHARHRRHPRQPGTRAEPASAPGGRTRGQ
jgi:hypothetical protein